MILFGVSGILVIEFLDIQDVALERRCLNCVFVWGIRQTHQVRIWMHI